MIVWGGEEQLKELEQMCLEYGILSEDVLWANGYAETPPSKGEVLLVPTSKNAVVPTWMEVQNRKNGDEPLVTVKLHGVPLSMRETVRENTDRTGPGQRPASIPTVPESNGATKNMRLALSGDEAIVLPGEGTLDHIIPPDIVLTPPKRPPSAPGFVASGKLMWPVTGRVSSGFGRRGKRRFHAGLDIPMPEGTPIRAAMDGVVLETITIKTPKYRGYGNAVLLGHGNGLVTLYAHCLSVSVKRGQTVKQGDVVGLVGNTGRSTTHHVHFEVRSNGRPINPLPLMTPR
jgi:murein DD-endopeptidase MepM/ murein hydrolase activator NlpD